MPRERFDEDDDRDDFPPPQPRPSSNPTVIILAVLGAVALLGLAVCVGLFVWMGARVAAPPVANEPAVIHPAEGKEGINRIYMRDEFRQLVMGKSEQEVTEELGKPNVADEAGDSKLWIYRDRTTDPATGKTDPKVSIRLQAGKVVAVEF